MTKLAPVTSLIFFLLASSCSPSSSPPEAQNGLSTTDRSSTTPPPVTPLPTSATTSTAVINNTFFPLPSGYLVYGSFGISFVGMDGNATALIDTPTSVAIPVGNSLLVVQEAENSDVYPPERGWSFEVYRPEVPPSLVTVSNRQLRLFDAGFTDAHPTAIATLVNWQDEETYESLIVVDLVPATSDDPGAMFTDLGRVGTSDSLVVNAKLAGDVIVFATPSQIEARTISGEVLWAAPSDRWDRPFVLTDDVIISISPSVAGQEGSPFLDLQTYALLTGSVLDERTIALDANIHDRFCTVVDWDGSMLLCDRSNGGPVAIDIESGRVEDLSNLEEGIPAAIGG